jgi:flagellin-specific chaperone FliS
MYKTNELVEKAEKELNSELEVLQVEKIKEKLIEIKKAQRILKKLENNLTNYLEKEDKDIIFSLD